MGAERFPEQGWQWWVSAGPAGAATWAGTILSAIGLAITLIGFFLAIKEARAATIAVRGLKSSLGTSSLAYTHSQVSILSQFINGGHFYPASVLLATVRRDVLHYANDAQASVNTIADLKKRLHTVSTHIGHAQAENGRYDAGKVQNALTGVQQTIVDWENALRQKAGEVSK